MKRRQRQKRIERLVDRLTDFRKQMTYAVAQGATLLRATNPHGNPTGRLRRNTLTQVRDNAGARLVRMIMDMPYASYVEAAGGSYFREVQKQLSQQIRRGAKRVYRKR